ncbi:MAG TPA: heme o synthase [Chloroflexota bacterium]|nr:heme o synthase [Chloroflexota bacterium]
MHTAPALQVVATTTDQVVPGLRQIAGDYVTLMKPRIMVLLLITTLASVLIAASTRHISHLETLRLVLLTLLGGALASGGASALNHYFDRDIDGLMTRTRKRPLPAGRLQPSQALIFGLLLSVLSVVVFTVWVNTLSALLALGGNLFYVVVYTLWLKRSTPQNIVIGGIAGAIPPLVGWAAVSDNIALPGILLFIIITLWTPPHFWSLALLTQKDYSRAAVPMLPVVRGLDRTRWNILVYTMVLVAFTLGLCATHAMGLFYLGAAAVLGSIFLWRALLLLREATAKRARACFVYSNIYLALLLTAMVIDRLIALS